MREHLKVGDLVKTDMGIGVIIEIDDEHYAPYHVFIIKSKLEKGVSFWMQFGPTDGHFYIIEVLDDDIIPIPGDVEDFTFKGREELNLPDDEHDDMSEYAIIQRGRYFAELRGAGTAVLYYDSIPIAYYHRENGCKITDAVLDERLIPPLEQWFGEHKVLDVRQVEKMPQSWFDGLMREIIDQCF